MSDTVQVQRCDRGVVTLTLNRPERRNAFDDALIAQLTALLSEQNSSDEVRAVVLTGAGKAFSSGADVGWMRSVADYSEADNLEDALRLAELMTVLDGLHKPTVARINGAVYGGAIGLVACCDIAVATRDAKFALSEVRLGIVPAVISPYVVRAIGARHARRFFLSGEAMTARQARRIGLIHAIAKPGKLDAAVARQIEMVLRGGPEALRESKELVALVSGAGESAQQHLQRRTAEIIAQRRVSPEGQEGLSAFLEKRPPRWQR